jgi:hypothetical protein
MPFDPNGDLYIAEPKLLSIDCFPIFSPRPAPPDYDLIMAANTRYNRVSEERRLSVDSSAGNEDLDVLLIDPHANDDGDTPPNKEHRFRCYPTVFTRLTCIILFIASFVLLIIGRRQGAIPAAVFVCIAFVRNIIVILHHIFSKHLRLRLEFRNRSPRSGKPRKGCPEWAKHGRLHLLLDVVLIIILIITAIIAATQSSNWSYGYYWENTGAVVAGLILDFVGM